MMYCDTGTARAAFHHRLGHCAGTHSTEAVAQDYRFLLVVADAVSLQVHNIWVTVWSRTAWGSTVQQRCACLCNSK